MLKDLRKQWRPARLPARKMQEWLEGWLGSGGWQQAQRGRTELSSMAGCNLASMVECLVARPLLLSPVNYRDHCPVTPLARRTWPVAALARGGSRTYW
jgi:hypothetical protein